MNSIKIKLSSSTLNKEYDDVLKALNANLNKDETLQHLLINTNIDTFSIPTTPDMDDNLGMPIVTIVDKHYVGYYKEPLLMIEVNVEF